MTQSIDEITANLDLALVEKGIPEVKVETDYDKFINMSYENVQKINGDEARQIAYMLHQCALNIQQKCNRIDAKLLTVKNNLNKALSQVYESYNTYNGYDIVLGKACIEYTEINDLNNLKIKLESELTDMKYMSKHVDEMAKIMNQLYWKK